MAAFLNRITKQLRDDDGTGEARPDEIRNPDLSAVAGLPSWQWSIDGDAVRPPTPLELSAYESTMMDGWRRQRIAEIDGRSQEIVTAGVEVAAGKVVGTSLAATQNLQNLVLGYQLGIVHLPQDISTIDGGSYTLGTGPELVRVAGVMASHQRSALDAGRSLRAAILNAATKAELDAIVDYREVPTWQPATL